MEAFVLGSLAGGNGTIASELNDQVTRYDTKGFTISFELNATVWRCREHH